MIDCIDNMLQLNWVSPLPMLSPHRLDFDRTYTLLSGLVARIVFQERMTWDARTAFEGSCLPCFRGKRLLIKDFDLPAYHAPPR